MRMIVLVGLLSFGNMGPQPTSSSNLSLTVHVPAEVFVERPIPFKLTFVNGDETGYYLHGAKVVSDFGPGLEIVVKDSKGSVVWRAQRTGGSRFGFSIGAGESITVPVDLRHDSITLWELGTYTIHAQYHNGVASRQGYTRTLMVNAEPVKFKVLPASPVETLDEAVARWRRNKKRKPPNVAIPVFPVFTPPPVIPSPRRKTRICGQRLVRWVKNSGQNEHNRHNPA